MLISHVNPPVVALYGHPPGCGSLMTSPQTRGYEPKKHPGGSKLAFGRHIKSSNVKKKALGRVRRLGNSSKGRRRGGGQRPLFCLLPDAAGGKRRGLQAP